MHRVEYYHKNKNKIKKAHLAIICVTTIFYYEIHFSTSNECVNHGSSYWIKSYFFI